MSAPNELPLALYREHEASGTLISVNNLRSKEQKLLNPGSYPLIKQFQFLDILTCSFSVLISCGSCFLANCELFHNQFPEFEDPTALFACRENVGKENN